MKEKFILWLKNNFESGSDAGRKIGVSRQTIQDWTTGKSLPRRKDIIDKVKSLGFNGADDLALYDDSNTGTSLATALDKLSFTKSVRHYDGEIPIYDAVVQAGIPRIMYEEANRIGGYNMRDKHIIKVRGDSMRDAGIDDGDEVIVRETSFYTNGDVIIARIGDEFTIKQVINGNGYTLLNPANPDFEPIPITPETDFQCLGVVEHVMKKPKRVFRRNN